MIDGVVRAPSLFSITLTLSPSITATQELVVPRSIPIILPISLLLHIACRSRIRQPARLNVDLYLRLYGDAACTFKGPKSPGPIFSALALRVGACLQATRPTDGNGVACKQAPTWAEFQSPLATTTRAGRIRRPFRL